LHIERRYDNLVICSEQNANDASMPVIEQVISASPQRRQPPRAQVDYPLEPTLLAGEMLTLHLRVLLLLRRLFLRSLAHVRQLHFHALQLARRLVLLRLHFREPPCQTAQSNTRTSADVHRMATIREQRKERRDARIDRSDVI